MTPGVQHSQGPSIDALEHLEQAYRDNLDTVLRVCRSFLKDPMDAEDAAQETFIRFARRAGNLPADAAVPYLTVVARNVCRDELKRRAQRALIPVDVVATEESIENRYLSIALTRSVWNRLNGRDRQLFAHVFAGYRYHETAARTGLSPQAVSVGLTRARHRARKALGAASAPLMVPWRDLRRWLDGRRREFAAANQAHLELVQTVALRTVIVGAVVGGGFGLVPGVPAAGQAPATSAREAVTMTALSAETANAQGALGLPSSAATTASSATEGGGHAYTSATASSVAGGVVNPAGGARPADAQFYSLTPSPRYAGDHTIWASGSLVNSCTRPTGCPVVFRSTDAGATWTPAASQGFSGGQVLLPPDPLRDPAVFAVGQSGLQQSLDGGATWLTLFPTAAAAAIDPASQPGHARLLVGVNPMVFYDAGSHLSTPGPGLPAGVLQPSQLLFAGGHVLGAASRLNPARGAQEAVSLSCLPGADCTVSLIQPNAMLLHLAASPTFATDHTVIAFSTDRLFTSRDGGETFALIGSHISGPLVAVAPASDLATSHRLFASASNSALQVSPITTILDDGSSPQTLGLSGLPQPAVITSVLPLPDGRLLVSLTGHGPTFDFGIRCSTDGGATWRPAC